MNIDLFQFGITLGILVQLIKKNDDFIISKWTVYKVMLIDGRVISKYPFYFQSAMFFCSANQNKTESNNTSLERNLYCDGNIKMRTVLRSKYWLCLSDNII